MPISHFFLGLSLSLFSGLFLGSSFAKADSFYVQESSVVGASKEEGQSATELVRIAISEMSHQVSPDTKSATFILKPKLVKLGSALTFALEKVKDEKIVFASQMKVQRIEELDVVANRLTRSVIEEKVAKNDARVEEVTEAESTKGSVRKETLNRWYLGFGPSKGENVNKSDTLTYVTLGYSWEIPSSHAAVKLHWDIVSDRFSTLNLGGQYYFKDTDISPFIGASLGLGSAVTDSTLFNTKSTSGFFISGIAGVQFFRTSRINVDMALSYSYMMSKNDLGNPAFYGFRVGLYF